jgi:hypothetical protein
VAYTRFTINGQREGGKKAVTKAKKHQEAPNGWWFHGTIDKNDDFNTGKKVKSFYTSNGNLGPAFAQRKRLGRAKFPLTWVKRPLVLTIGDRMVVPS